jgi:crossover junction endodeoxyribonuclease RuvC
MRVLAIDPGYERVGLAVVEKITGREMLISSECFQTPKKLPFEDRLFLIGQRASYYLETYVPDSLAIEKLFFNTNQKTALQVSEARGVMIYEAMRHQVPVFEYTPLQIKIAITGYGRGDKKQVVDMVEKLITIEKKIRFDDEYDAIAVGLTHIASFRSGFEKS